MQCTKVIRDINQNILAHTLNHELPGNRLSFTGHGFPGILYGKTSVFRLMTISGKLIKLNQHRNRLKISSLPVVVNKMSEKIR